VRQFPVEFSALLSPAGHRLLEGRHPRSGILATGQGRFVAQRGLLDAQKAAQVLALLERSLGDVMSPMEQRIPPEATTGMKRAYEEKLPKTVMVRTAFLDHPRARARKRAVDCGLVAMMMSRSFHAFAEALSGYPLRKKWGLQALCYHAGDYSGPHNDHHPDEALGRDGYTDLHLTFSNGGCARQLLVYEQRGHLSQVEDVTTFGGVTCYRLPFWHYTTPLEAKRGREAHRWVLLGTFLDRWDDPPTAR
jgi:hypothetical protein